ncbi:glycosyltransferase family 4 protein [Malikia spinosa]|uniref:Glycosyltransferase family 4 protein n=1 Tax=Malikia spinosa TaxID=86180 RepID=A0A7C9MSM0_9BURK|nr:glycosyltransferase family 4 protein [Malikia spinosa]MYZ52998.1 glycosyltransferase family 4 protein [Malikia spinosa]
MKTKSLLLVQHEVNENNGIGKKIISQKKALLNLGYYVEICSLVTDNNGKYYARVIDGKIFELFQKKYGLNKKLQWIWGYSKIFEYITAESIKFVYIRYTHFANPFFIYFLKRLRDTGVLIYLEIPTYPYDSEYKDITFGKKILLTLEQACRMQFKNKVNRIITVTDDTKIFGIETINIDNGIDINTIPVKRWKASSSSIRVIIVSSFEFWHGYERLIHGMAQYQKKQKSIDIHFDFIGHNNTTTCNEYKRLVNLYGLEDKFKFHGYLTGKSLDQIFDVADVAIGVIGGHRKGLDKLKALKNREYCARGIPFAYSGSDPSFDGCNFVLKLQNDESPINISELIDWAISIPDVTELMRKHAIDNLTWDKQMSKIAESANYFLKQK